MKKINKALAIALSFIMILATVPVISVSAKDITTEYIPSSPYDVMPADVSTEPANNRSDDEIPAYFDARDSIAIPEIRNQNPYGDCWAHASTAAIEVSLIKQGLATQDINLSELSLVENVYSPTKDKMGLLGEDSNNPVGSTALNLGGNNTEVAFNLARWSGLTNEAAMSQSTDAAYENADGYYSDDYYYQLNEAQLVKYMKVSTSESTDTLKKLIMEYGIAVTAYYDDSTYRNNSTGAIYSTTHSGSTNHEIAIIGWDDDYAVTNFKSGSQPSQPGAWLVRNSWGTWIGQSGYCWLSYDDTSLDDTMAFFTVCSSDNYDNNYQYDGTYSLSASSAWHGAANIYTSQQNEYIKAVNLSLLDYTDTDVTVRIYVDPSQNFLLDDTPAATQTFHNTYEGIYTIALDNPVYVTEGTDFAVYYSFSSDPTSGTDSHSYDYSRTSSWSWLSMTEDKTNARSVTFNYSTCKTQNFTNGVWRIKAYTVNADGPAIPDNFKVTLDGTNAVLTWDFVEGATEYEIYSGTDIGGYSLAATVTEESATIPVTDENGIVIKYKVRAKIYDETGDFCNARAIRLTSNTNVSALAIADAEVALGGTVKATPTFTPTTSTKTVNDIMVCYTVADSTIANVTPTGEITGVKAGTTTITGLTRNSAKTATATITVNEQHTCVAGDPVNENEIAATCTAGGSYDSVTYCTICKAEISRERVIVAATGHSYGNWAYDGASAKTHTRTCANDSTHTETANCTFDAGVVTTPAKCTTAGVKTYTCSVCGGTYTESISATGHTVVNDAAVAATCTTAGKTAGTHCSVCNTVLTAQETIPAKGHSWNDGEVTTPANCVDTGVKTYTCTVCEATKTETIPVDSANHKTVVTDEAVAATCTETGLTEGSHCSACNTVIVAQKTVKALGHSFTKYVSDGNATCTENGTETAKCDRCTVTDTRTEADSALGHDFTNTSVKDETTLVSAATCTAKAVYKYTCSRCSAIGTDTYETGEANGHSWNDGEGTTPANCVDTGVKTYTCTVCKATKTETIAVDSANHKTVVTDKAVAATCTDTGLTEGSHCSACNTVIVAQKTVDVLGHSFTKYVSDGNATCTEDGTETAKCDRCTVTDTRTEADSALGHDFTNTSVKDETTLVSAATCTAKAVYKYTCSRCSAIGTKTYETGEANGHSWNDGEVTTPANCVDTGVKTYTCSVCSATKTETIPVDSANHKTVVTDEAVAATCTETGLTEGSHCSACNTVIKAQETVNSLGHSFTKYVSNNNATCTEDGTETAKCDRCTVTDTRTEENSSLGHDFTNTSVKDETTLVSAATCTAKAVYKYTCSRCTAIGTKTYETGKANGHSWNDGEVTTKANCVDTGVKTYTCTVCKATKTETIPVDSANHKTVVTDKAVAATCTDIGLTEGSHCSACNTVIKAQKTVKALGHNNVSCEAIPATCTATGCEAYTVCKRCGYSTYKEIATIAHNYVNGVCTMCGAAEPDASETCTHLCHKSGFMGFIWKIINLFNKLFKINQYCECGAAHW